MKAADFSRLVAQGEHLHVEFKGEEKGPLSDSELVETVVCLANRTGQEPGWLLIGVEDDGRITGARSRHGDRTVVERVQALIGNRTRPSLPVRAWLAHIQDREILVIAVEPSATPVGTADGRYLRRALGGDGRPACVPFHFHEMRSRQADRGLLDSLAGPVPGVEWGDLDALEFDRFRRHVRENRGRGDESLLALADVELAQALGAVDTGSGSPAVTALGLLLFGREAALRAHLPTHEVAFQVLEGTQVRVNDFLRWPVLRLFEEIEGRFRANNREQELIDGLFRVAVPDYSALAFREALANALVHRDYARLGAVHIQWHRDHLSISNPGGFPEGVRLDNLLVTQPRPRNPLLADAMKRAGIVERTARGIDTIYYEQLRYGRPAPSYERSTEVGVEVVLWGGMASLEFVRMVVQAARGERALGLDELLILDELSRERRVSTADAALRIQKPAAEARATLERLVEAGLVEGRGERKGRVYHLSAETYRKLGAKAAYVRQRGFEPLQQEQMILQYVVQHGRITRREAAELCRVAARQARTVLVRLVARGDLELRGARKGAFYVRSSINMDEFISDRDSSHKPLPRPPQGGHNP